MSAGLKHWKPYPEYKESGVEWLGKVPARWEVTRLKFCVKSGFQYGANIAAELDAPSLPRYIRITDMNDDGTLKDETFRSLLFEEAAPYLLKDKDILLARSGATVGKSFIYRESMGLAAYAGYLIRIAAGKDISPFFLYLFLNSKAYWQWVKSIFIQATIQNVSAEKYANFALAIPPLHEQRAISAFLDQQCAQIDSLIEKKQRMLDLLDEKRRAVITQAVTRGLDPSVPMKDSGVEWLGMVPEGWEVMQLRRTITSVKTGATPAGTEDYYFDEDGFPWYTPADFSEILLLCNASRKLSQLGIAHVKQFPINTVMIVGIGATMGKVGISQQVASCNQQINAIVFENKIVSIFGAYFLSTLREYLFKCGKFTTLPILNQEETRNIILCVPPLPEQQAIADYLDAQCAAMDSQRKSLEKSIELLREYRSSLITHAVTGKIDVRELAPLQ